MARRPRYDTPGSWHHVVNRGIAKRPYFEVRADQRFFLSRLAAQVRAGRVEVHAYTLMTTHFHLLLRSPAGELSEAMRRVQYAYSRYFNRQRRRDGPLIRARFFSKRVDSDGYRRTLVRYIDENAVRARLVRAPEEHEFGSARAYLGARMPPWLEPGWVRQHARSMAGQSTDAAAYRATYGSSEVGKSGAIEDLVDLRLASASEVDPLDDLIGKSPVQVRRWMIRKARLADGMKIGLPVCGPTSLRAAIDDHLERHGEWLVDLDGRTFRGSLLARCGLLRDLCTLTIEQVASSAEVSPWLVKKHTQRHRQALAECGEYARIISEITHRALP